MDDPDLTLLRNFRIEEAEPPPGMQARIEERLWQAILAEEASRAHARRRRSWFQEFLRPAVAAGAAASIAVGVAFAGGGDGRMATSSSTPVRQAGVLDATAASLFGTSASTATSSAPIAGAIDLRSPDESLVRGPRLDGGVGLDEQTRSLVRDMTRDPAELQSRLRASAASVAGAEHADRVAFHGAMQWVVASQVPTDVRAAMLRSLEGLSGVDAALVGVDLLGRRGVVLGHLDFETGLRSQYLLDPEGGRLLEQRTFTTGYVDPACPPGTFTSHGIYDDEGRSISQADAPWLDWPLVVPACDPAGVAQPFVAEPLTAG